MGARDAGVDLAEGELGPRHQADEPYERGGAVEDAAELGDDEAAPAVAAEDRRLVAADPGEVVGRGGRPLDLRAVVRGDLLGDARGGDGQRHPPAAPVGRDQVEHDQQGPVVLDDPALLVHEREPLADGVEPDAERGPRGGHYLAEPHQSGPAALRGLGRPGLVEPRVDGERVDAEPPQQAGQDQPGTAVGGVDDDLEPGVGDPAGVDVPQQRAGVRVEDAGREVQVADLPGEGTPVLLAGVDPVQLALAALGEVASPPVEEHDVDGVGDARGGTDHDAAGAAARRLLPGDGQRHVLQVAYVDGAGLEGGDDRPLEGAGASRVVAGGGDRRTLLEGGGIRAGQADGEFGGDLDVEDAGDTTGAEEVRLAARLPDD